MESEIGLYQTQNRLYQFAHRVIEAKHAMEAGITRQNSSIGHRGAL
jgi:hypothetical protein